MRYSPACIALKSKIYIPNKNNDLSKKLFDLYNPLYKSTIDDLDSTTYENESILILLL